MAERVRYYLDPGIVYQESEKYGEWEVGDLLRTLARIELVAREAMQCEEQVDPRWIIQELGLDG